MAEFIMAIDQPVAFQGFLYLFGETSIEVWWNSGNPDFPFERLGNGVMEYGTISPASIATSSDAIFWLGRNGEGDLMVMSTSGETAQRVSNHNIEWHLNRINTITDAEGFSYRQAGHTFYVLTFPTEGKTFTFDISTGMWHTRVSPGLTALSSKSITAFANLANTGKVTVTSAAHGFKDYMECTITGTTSYNATYTIEDVTTNTFSIIATWVADDATGTVTHDNNRWRPSGTIYFNGDHIVGDYSTNQFYKLKNNVFKDNGTKIKRVRETASTFANNQRIFWRSVEILFESGVGNADSADPQVTLSWSDDGGHNYTSGRSVSLGTATQKTKRVLWRQLGSTTRGRIYRIEIDEPVDVTIIDAWAQVDVGTDY